jgi:hypothetical protein
MQSEVIKRLATITTKWLPNKATHLQKPVKEKVTPFGVIIENDFTNHRLCPWLVKGNHFVVIKNLHNYK